MIRLLLRLDLSWVWMRLL